jgi:general nucleoside transport system permease protein
MSRPLELPRLVDLVVVPALTVLTAFVMSGLVVLAIGENPLEAIWIVLKGALGSASGIGFTLYYATTFIFAGLAVALAFQAGLFNIGGEGQAAMAGLGAVLALFLFEGSPTLLLVPAGILGAMLFGGAYAFLPGYLQAMRGSHVVITTIMFNFIAMAILEYLLANWMGRPGSGAPESRFIPAASVLPSLHQMVASFGFTMPRTPLNLSFVLALVAAVAVWVLLWHTRLGYEMRVVGAQPPAAVYAGIKMARITIFAMVMSGALAGLVAVNEIMGVQHRLVLGFTEGAGYVGIAVALMGRAHPLGVVLASLLFGVLYQGGTELAFDKPSITRDMIVVMQGFVILFAGALGFAFQKPLSRFFKGHGA